MSDGLARQMIGQGAAPRLSACRLDRLGDDRSRREALGLVDLQSLDGAFEMLDAGLQLLGRDAELRRLQPGEFAAELLDQRVGMNGVPRHAEDHAFERIHVIRKRSKIKSYVNSLACPRRLCQPLRARRPSARDARPVRALRCPPVDPLRQHRELSRCERRRSPAATGQTKQPLLSRFEKRHKP